MSWLLLSLVTASPPLQKIVAGQLRSFAAMVSCYGTYRSSCNLADDVLVVLEPGPVQAGSFATADSKPLVQEQPLIDAPQHTAPIDPPVKHDFVSAVSIKSYESQNRKRQLEALWLKYTCRYCRYENGRQDHLRDHHRKKHRGHPFIDGPVRITDSWCAVACGMCPQIYEATPGHYKSMHKAQKNLVTHVVRQHSNDALAAWQVSTAVRGLLQMQEVAPIWNDILRRYQCEHIHNPVAELMNNKPYAEWWYRMLRQPADPQWLRDQLPSLLYAGIEERYPIQAMTLAENIASSDFGPTTWTTTHDLTAAGAEHSFNDTMTYGAGSSTVSRSVTSYYTQDQAPMEKETAPTTADLRDLLHAQHAGFKPSDIHDVNAPGHGTEHIADPGDANMLKDVGNNPHLA